MIALPSIAFGGFSGSAKGVTARQVGGRSILSVKCWPTGAATGAQLVRRASLKKISKSWNKLALSQEARSVLGTKGKISGANLFTRLNYWIVACGGTPETNPPTLVGVENPSSATIVCQVTPSPSSWTRLLPTTAESSWSSKPPKVSPTV